MRCELNKKPSIVRLKNELVEKIPYVPKSSKSKEILLDHDVGELLHIYHFWRQRFLQPLPRRYYAPSSVRNDLLYIKNKTKISELRRMIEAGNNVSGYLSRRVHERALDVNGYRQTGSFNSSRDQMLICEGFYHLHLKPLPERTDEILVAKVDSNHFEVVGLFTHELFLDDRINPDYLKYNIAVDSYLARKMPSGGNFIGGAGGGMQNLAGSSIASMFWQIACMKALLQVENWPSGISGFTINLYDRLFHRQIQYVKPIWVVADDMRLLLHDRKNKHDFWLEPSGNWRGQPCI